MRSKDAIKRVIDGNCAYCRETFQKLGSVFRHVELKHKDMAIVTRKIAATELAKAELNLEPPPRATLAPGCTSSSILASVSAAEASLEASGRFTVNKVTTPARKIITVGPRVLTSAQSSPQKSIVVTPTTSSGKRKRQANGGTGGGANASPMKPAPKRAATTAGGAGRVDTVILLDSDSDAEETCTAAKPAQSKNPPNSADVSSSGRPTSTSTLSSVGGRGGSATPGVTSSKVTKTKIVYDYSGTLDMTCE